MYFSRTLPSLIFALISYSFFFFSYTEIKSQNYLMSQETQSQEVTLVKARQNSGKKANKKMKSDIVAISDFCWIFIAM